MSRCLLSTLAVWPLSCTFSLTMCIAQIVEKTYFKSSVTLNGLIICALALFLSTSIVEAQDSQLIFQNESPKLSCVRIGDRKQNSIIRHTKRGDKIRRPARIARNVLRKIQELRTLKRSTALKPRQKRSLRKLRKLRRIARLCRHSELPSDESPPPDPPSPTPEGSPGEGCDCGSDDGCLGREISRESFGTNFKWEFSCNNERPCRCGQFVNGDYWVAAVDDMGLESPSVRITKIAPDGEAHGAMDNPRTRGSQGLLSGYSNYTPALNVMTQLPYDSSPGSSIIKVKRKDDSSQCGTSAIKTHGCADVYDVLTILGEIPEDEGKESFRPPFHGTEKPLFSLSKLKLGRLPKFPMSLTDNNFEEIALRWNVPHYDLGHVDAPGEFMRATIPHEVLNHYFATNATIFLNDLFSLFGSEDTEEKLPAVVAMTQRGIDTWSIWRLGIPFGSGAGQYIGPKFYLALFAALYDDEEILEEVRSIASDPNAFGFFQADTQLYRGASGVVLWGDGKCNPEVNYTNDEVQDHGNWYWNGVISELRARTGGSGYDNKGTRCDPHGYIDGPPGTSSPTQPQGRDYQFCCSAGPLVGYAFAQQLMPWLKYAAGDSEVLEYADRIYRGRGIADFDGGFWAAPDICAPPDMRDVLNDDCQPYSVSGRAACDHYGVTWGPIPGDARNCIISPEGDTRWPEEHGPAKDILRLPSAVRDHWDTLRDCADPDDSSYPCEGLGEIR